MDEYFCAVSFPEKGQKKKQRNCVMRYFQKTVVCLQSTAVI